MKYPEYIYRNVRQTFGLDAQDTSKDAEINRMDKIDVLGRYWQWEGIIGYEYKILQTVCDIYGFKEKRHGT